MLLQVISQDRKAAIKQQEELNLEYQRQKILMGRAAYSQWIKLRKEKDKLLLKQRCRGNSETQYSHYYHESHVLNACYRTSMIGSPENQKIFQQAYENWKAQKDLEQELAQLASSDSSLEPKSN